MPRYRYLAWYLSGPIYGGVLLTLVNTHNLPDFSTLYSDACLKLRTLRRQRGQAVREQTFNLEAHILGHACEVAS